MVWPVPTYLDGPLKDEAGWNLCEEFHRNDIIIPLCFYQWNFSSSLNLFPLNLNNVDKTVESSPSAPNEINLSCRLFGGVMELQVASGHIPWMPLLSELIDWIYLARRLHHDLEMIARKENTKRKTYKSHSCHNSGDDSVKPYLIRSASKYHSNFGSLYMILSPWSLSW